MSWFRKKKSNWVNFGQGNKRLLVNLKHIIKISSNESVLTLWSPTSQIEVKYSNNEHCEDAVMKIAEYIES